MIDQMDLHAFVDGELDADEQASVRAALDLSPSDAREVEAIRRLKSALIQKTSPPEVGPQWKKCVRRLDELDRTRRVERAVGRFAPAMCAGLFVVIVLAGRFARHPDRNSVSSPDLARMVSNLSPMQPPTKLEFDKARWLSGLLSQSWMSTPDHLTVRSVSTGVINDTIVKSYSARDQKGDLTILVIPQPLNVEGMKSMGDQSNLRVGMLNGVNCVVRRDGDTTVFFVAERGYQELADAAAQFVLR